MNIKELMHRYALGHRDFSRASLIGANLSRMQLMFVNFSNANLQNSNLIQAHLAGAELSQANLQYANLIRANLTDTDLTWANLRGANLSRAMLEGAALQGANLSHTNFNKASLSGANLSGANLRQANLRGANLKSAILKAADLRGADLHQATLDGADLTDTLMPNTEPLLPTNSSPQTLPILSFAEEIPDGTRRDISQTPTYAKQRTIGTKATPEQAVEAEWIVTAQERMETATSFGFNDAEKARGQIMVSIMRRRGHHVFRHKLLTLYNYQCAISRCNNEPVLEAAYILPYCGETTQQPMNGLLLRADLHTLFDLHLLTIDPNTMTVVLAPMFQGSSYAEFQGRSLHLPSNPSLHPNQEALTHHFNACGWLQSEAWADECYSKVLRTED